MLIYAIRGIRTTLNQFLLRGLLLLGLLSLSTLAAAKDAEPWPFWEKHNSNSTATIDHSAWDTLLKKYISQRGDLNRFAYGKVTRTDKQALKQYLTKLQAVKIRGYARLEQKAYWTNLYNAATIDVVLTAYPVDSIQDIDTSPGLFSSGPWGKKIVTVEGKKLSLDDIEHRILRPIWNTPLTHYTVNCASIGCPNLADTAFTGENITRMQIALAKAFINSKRGARVKDGDLTVSKIYDWFEDDFGGSEKAVIRHLRRYATGTLAKQLKRIDDIDDYEYDWSLNIAK